MTNTATQRMTREQTIGDFVSGLPHLRLHPDTPVASILAIMSQSGKRIAGIADANGRFIGFVTRSALLGRLVIGAGFDVGLRIDTGLIDDLTARDVMIPRASFLPSELGLSDALAIMTEYGYHAMPVLDGKGVLLGLAEMRQLVEAHQSLTQDLIESKDNLLSYLMHHENYGLCGRI